MVDLSISYSHRESPKVPLWLLILLSVILPAVTIVLLSLRGSHSDMQSKARKANNALLGLGASLGTATVVLNIKNLAGKPRPDFLAICQPDLDKVKQHTVGGFGQRLSPLWVMVDREVCRQPDHWLLNDAFRSFPSGYATSEILSFLCSSLLC